jgi:hypothetical protein
MMFASYFFINTLLQRGILRVAETQNRFQRFLRTLSKTAEAVKEPSTTLPHPAESRGLMKRTRSEMAMFVNHSG